MISNNTKLHAINRVFDAMGQAGINTMQELDYNIDAGDIARNIDSHSATIQVHGGKGYWFNREGFHKLFPDPDTGRIKLPNGALAVRLKRLPLGAETSLTVRGRYLMDMKEHGYDMRPFAEADGRVHLVVIMFVDYDDLPQTAKDAVVALTRFWFIQDKEVDSAKLQSLRMDISSTLTALELEDSSHMRRNAFHNKYMHHDLAMIGGFLNNN
ncbi:putative tail tubular protein A [Aeromonas phage MJG]|uniref:Putative tail tubular protein A n=1 Tax=Aeromonas phage MJG TaxID=2510451 RepID=A0A5J5ZZH3_9CAUD|nr:putative tail tubular protein A [Aeromonas phage MJG]